MTDPAGALMVPYTVLTERNPAAAVDMVGNPYSAVHTVTDINSHATVLALDCPDGLLYQDPSVSLTLEYQATSDDGVTWTTLSTQIIQGGVVPFLFSPQVGLYQMNTACNGGMFVVSGSRLRCNATAAGLPRRGQVGFYAGLFYSPDSSAAGTWLFGPNWNC